MTQKINRKSEIENELCKEFNFFDDFLRDTASEETTKTFDEHMANALAYLQLSDEDDKYLDLAEEQVRELQKIVANEFAKNSEFLVTLFNVVSKIIYQHPASDQKQCGELIEQGKQAIEDNDPKKLEDITNHMLKLKYKYDNNQ